MHRIYLETLIYSCYDNVRFMVPSAFERQTTIPETANHQNHFPSWLKPQRLIFLPLPSVRNRLLYTAPSISTPLQSIPPLHQVLTTRTWNCYFIWCIICREHSSTSCCSESARLHPPGYVLEAEWVYNL